MSDNTTTPTHVETCRACGARVEGHSPRDFTAVTGPGLIAPGHECATTSGLVRTDSTPRALAPTTRTSRVHYMGDPGCQRTACGRYAPLTIATLSTTPDPAQVTCSLCRVVMKHA